MQWIAPSEKDAANDKLENRLWAAADQFRASSGLRAAQYSQPVLGLKDHIKNGNILVGMDGDFHMCTWSSGHAFQNQRVAKFESRGEIGRRYATKRIGRLRKSKKDRSAC